MKNVKQLAKRIGFFAILIAIWQIAYVIGVDVLHMWKSYAMPSPAAVFEKAVMVLQRPAIYEAVFFSLQRAFTGFVISVLIGSLLGFLMTKFNYLKENLKPIILGLQTLPSICWVSFAILWYGLDSQAVIFVIVISASFSMAMSAYNSLMNVNPLYVKAAKTMGASEWQLYSKVLIPACMPEVILGLRQTWAFSWRALMSAEMMISMIGLGQTLDSARSIRNDVNEVIVIMLVIILIGTIIDSVVFQIMENRILKRRGLLRDE